MGTSSQKTVAILGGGVAGLSAAHELAERGFAVHVYERKPVLGGKARSIPVPGSAPGGRPIFPGEHGFRFFPGFYQHVTDTMRRIALRRHGNTYDNLTVATRMLLARAGQTEITWVARCPAEPRRLPRLPDGASDSPRCPADEVSFFVSRLLIVATSCPERRLAEYENIAWWDFIGAPRMSNAYQAYLGQGITRSLVAMRAEESSTRTVGTTQLQLLNGLISPDRVFDRLLSGPTNDVWIDPWTEHLEKLGVVFHPGSRVTGSRPTGGRVTGATIETAGGRSRVTADFYIAALPVEVMSALMTDELKRAAPSLAGSGQAENAVDERHSVLSLARMSRWSTATPSIWIRRGR